MVGGFISFHADHSLPVKQKNISTQAKCEIRNNSVDTEHDEDPCSQGFCHLGHCATLVISARVFETTAIDFISPFYVKAQRAHERILDGPFQPPRIV